MNIQSYIDEFFSRYTKLQYKKGEIVLRAGDPPSEALYLNSGLVRMSFAKDKEDSGLFHVFNHAQVFPMLWIMKKYP